MTRNLALSAFFFLPLSAFSSEVVEQAIPIVPEYDLSAELGFLYKSGNTKSVDIKAGLNLRHQKNQWTNEVAFNFLGKKLETESVNNDGATDKNFVTTDNKWNITTQTNYTLNPEGKNYLYGNLAYEEDQFSSFEKQSSISSGWGRNWYKTKKASLFADVGPGYKYDIIRESETIMRESKGGFIIQAQALYLRKINEFVEFRQLVIAKYAVDTEENSVYKAETSITTKLIESLQLKFTITIDHNTEVEEGFDNTDTQTAMTLVYSF
ncbi:MAG: putative salt-induced outer membrane protein [Alteromonadaceae bacterium]|jgi:putative salt-induced outer membrane protein|tara:strand:+ start:760 stop:1557 length:798 start_codon:yes stop_codon:yes gene_type:complete